MTDNLDSLLEDILKIHGTETEKAAEIFLEHSNAFLQLTFFKKAVRVGSHVLGEHLGRVQELQNWLVKAAPQQKNWDVELQRSVLAIVLACARILGNSQSMPSEKIWNLSLSESTLPESIAFEAAFLCGNKRLPEGLAKFKEVFATAEQAKALPALRSIAIKTNNAALELLDRPSRSAPECEIMEQLGLLSRSAWLFAGDWTHDERADWLLCRIYLSISNETQYQICVKRGLATILKNGDDPFEKVFFLGIQAKHAKEQGDPNSENTFRAEIMKIISENPTETWISEEINKFYAI